MQARAGTAGEDDAFHPPIFAHRVILASHVCEGAWPEACSLSWKASRARLVQLSKGSSVVSWFELLWATIVTLALLGVTGGSLAWVVGLRGYWAVAAAPAFGLTMIGGTAIVAPWLGLRWSILPVLLVTLVLGLVLWFARSLTRRWRAIDVPDPATRARFDIWVLVGVGVATVLISLRVLDAIGAPTNFSQTFDNIFHLNAVRFVLDTGNASSLYVGRMTNPGGALGFYPAAWHGAVALIVQLTGIAIPIAVNAMSVAVAAVVWPLGIVLLTRTLFGRGPVLTVAAGILSTAFPLFPMLLLDYGVLYPYQLGLALVPVALAATAQALGLCASSPSGMPRIWWAIVLLGTLPGIALAHPGALVSWLALSSPMVLIFAILRLRAARSARGRWIVVGLFVVYLIAGVLALKVLRPPLEARGWPTVMSVPAAAWEVLSVSAWFGVAAAIAAIAVLAGIVWAVLTRTATTWVSLGMYVVAAVLFITVASLPFGTLRDALTGAWYNNIPRLAAMLPLAMVPLAAYGVARTTGALAKVPAVSRARVSVAPVWRGTIGVAGIVIGALLVQGPALAVASTSVSHAFAITPSSVLVNSDEYALLQRLDSHVPDGVAIAGSPWTGSSMAYALADRPVLMPHTLMEITDELELVNEGLSEATPGSSVCAAMSALGVGFVLDFGTQEVHGAVHEFPGFEDLAGSPAVELVDHEGDARLYAITGCAAGLDE